MTRQIAPVLRRSARKQRRRDIEGDSLSHLAEETLAPCAFARAGLRGFTQTHRSPQTLLSIRGCGCCGAWGGDWCEVA